jgi:homoserine dehydrogenase
MTAKQIGVGIIGFGTVGRGTAASLVARGSEFAQLSGADVRVVAVSRRSPVAADELPGDAQYCADWRNVVASPDVQIIVETIGGTSIALEVVRAALAARKPVVTANKNLLAEHGDELFSLARRCDVLLAMEGAVAGSVPVLRALAESLSGDRILSLRGILNGTANYILTQMERERLPFEQALHEAQRAGLAEADPSFDIDGIDARDKLSILARLAFNGRVRPQQIPTRGIRAIAAVDFDYARRLSSTVRLVASAELHDGEYDLAVQPWLVRCESKLASVEGAENAVIITGERAGTHMLHGYGAGGLPTGVAVASDVLAIARRLASGTLRFQSVAGFDAAPELKLSNQPQAVPWYLRLTVRDRPGIVARVADALARHEMNIDAIVQEPGMSRERLSFVVTVEPALATSVAAALGEINRMDFMVEPVVLLRAEGW